jgi:hypothetical protein
MSTCLSLDLLSLVDLPLGAGIDLIGLIVFIIIALISQFFQKGNKDEDEDDEASERPPPKPRPQPRRPEVEPGSGKRPQPLPENDLMSEMRRIIEEARSVHERREPVPPPVPTRPSPPPLPAIPTPPPVPVSVLLPEKEGMHDLIEHVHLPSHEASEMHEGPTFRLIQSGPLATSAEMAEPAPAPAMDDDQAYALESELPHRPRYRFDPRILRSRDSIRDAFVLTEIMGKPKSLQSLDPHGPQI